MGSCTSKPRVCYPYDVKLCPGHEGPVSLCAQCTSSGCSVERERVRRNTSSLKLVRAARHDDLEKALEALNEGCDLTFIDWTVNAAGEGTAMYQACKEGHGTVLQVILDRMTDEQFAFRLNHQLYEDIEKACSKGTHGSVVAAICKRMNYLEDPTFEKHRTRAINLLAKHGAPRELEVVLEHCPSVCAFSAAAKIGNTKVLQCLLARDPELVHSWWDNASPLAHALRSNHSEAVALLVARGADVTPWDVIDAAEFARKETQEAFSASVNARHSTLLCLAFSAQTATAGAVTCQIAQGPLFDVSVFKHLVVPLASWAPIIKR